MLNRRALLFGSIATALAKPLAVEGQPAGKMRRIGVLLGVSPSPAHPIEGFRQGLRDLGYEEGRNIALEYRWTEGTQNRFPELARDLVRVKVDVIVAGITAAALAARNATQTIPIVTVLVYDPVRLGLATSFARPGGNVTGLTSLASLDIYGKQLELLKEAVPRVSRVGVLANPANPTGALQVRECEIAAQALGIQSQVFRTQGPEDVDISFAAMTNARLGALLVLADSMFYAHRVQIKDLAAKHRLPTMYGLKEHAEEGGLMSYSADFADLYRRAAGYVDKILRGASPSTLPIEQPIKFELVINLKTARALNLTIPPSLLLRADKVIE